MIVRTWTARALASNVDAYVRHFRDLLDPAFANLPGFLGGQVLKRPVGAGDESEMQIVVVTRWESLDAIRGFAGDDLLAAVIEPAAAAVLLSYDKQVEHYSVVHEIPAVGPASG